MPLGPKQANSTESAKEVHEPSKNHLNTRCAVVSTLVAMVVIMAFGAWGYFLFVHVGWQPAGLGTITGAFIGALVSVTVVAAIKHLERIRSQRKAPSKPGNQNDGSNPTPPNPNNHPSMGNGKQQAPGMQPSPQTPTGASQFPQNHQNQHPSLSHQQTTPSGASTTTNFVPVTNVPYVSPGSGTNNQNHLQVPQTTPSVASTPPNSVHVPHLPCCLFAPDLPVSSK